MNTAQATATAGLNAMNALLNGGTLSIYTGTIPASPQAGATGTKLATWTFSGTAFSAPTFVSSNMESTATLASNTVTPVANGTGGYARSFKSDGTTPVCDYTVGTSGADINLTTTTFATTVPSTISSFKHKLPAV